MGPHLQHHQLLPQQLPGVLQRRRQVHRAAQPALPVVPRQLLQACPGHRADERHRGAATQWKGHGQLTGLNSGELNILNQLEIDAKMMKNGETCSASKLVEKMVKHVTYVFIFKIEIKHDKT